MSLESRITSSIDDSIKSERTREFFRRVWSTKQDIYKQRLKQIGFCNLNQVLDAGCGVGQWSVALASLNNHVDAIDIDLERLEVSKKVSSLLNIQNINFKQKSLEEQGIQENYYDAIFCYSSIYYTDVSVTLANFYKLLKKGGSLYFCTNGLGWYIHNIINNPNQTIDFSPRESAIKSIKNTINYYRGGSCDNDYEIIMPSVIAKDIMNKIGFKDITIKPEGFISIYPDLKPELQSSFFKGEYYQEEGVYEVLAHK